MNIITRKRKFKEERKRKPLSEVIEFALQYAENERKNKFMKWFTNSLIFIYTLVIGIIIISCLVK
jgi:hypothetical protein